MVSFSVIVGGRTIRSGLTEAETGLIISQIGSRAERKIARVVRDIPPTPVPPGGGFQVFTIARGGGRTPQTLSVVKTFGTRAEAERFVTQRQEFATRDTPVGIRQTPSAAEAATFKRTRAGEQITGPAPKGKPTTRTAAEQRDIQQKAATLALKNIRAGRSRASPETIAKLKAQEKTQKQFVEERTIKRLTKGTTLTQFKTFAEIGSLKKAGVVERARETKKQQLRKTGGELIFETSEKFFGVVPTGINLATKIPTEPELIQELKAQKGFVTFKAPKKEEEAERIKQISVFKPIVVKPKPKEKRKLPLTTLGIPRKFKPEDLILVTPVAGLSPVQESKIITKTRQELLRLFPKFPVFVSTLIGGVVAIKEKPISKIVTPILIGAGLTLLPEPVTTVAGLALLGLTAREFFKAKPIERQVLAGQFVTDLPFFFLGTRAGKKGKELITKGITKIRPSFRKVEIDFLGEKIIKDIPTKEGGLLDLGLIPPGKGGVRIDIKAVVSKTEIPFKEKPTLPKTTKTQAEILEVVKNQPAIVTGSFAQAALLRKSRGFADIDIVTKDISAVAKSIKQKLGDKVIIETKTITDSPLGTFKIKRIIERKTGRILADIDPLKFAEEGLLKGKLVDVDFPIRTIEGVRLAPLEARLAAKLSQLKRGKQTEKVITDIELITGQKGIQQRLKSPLIRGAFGFTREEQAAFIGKTGPVTTSARDLFGRLFRKEIEVTEPGLFATPFELLTGRALTRVSRLALKEKEATPLDILRLSFRFKEGRPQIVVFPKQKIGEDFKPFGFPSSELEVLLKAGKIIKKEKQIAVTLIEGKKVPIIEASIKDASKRARTLLRKKELSIKEQQELSRRLAKETGFDISSILKTKPLLRPSRFIPKVGVTRKVTTRRTRDIITRAISTLPFIETTRLISGPPSRRLSGLPSGPVSGIISGPPSARPSALPSGALSTSLLGPVSGFPSIPPSRRPSGPVSARPSGPPSRRPSGLPPPPSGPITAIPSREEEGKRVRKGFNTFLRKGAKRGDKFVKIADNNPKNLAIQKGANAADFFIENSFRIQSSGRTTRKRDIPRVNLKKFRGIRKGSVLPGDTIIERKGKPRLDRAGELLQISFFRQQALKNQIIGQIQRKRQIQRRMKQIPRRRIQLQSTTIGGVMRFL